jgi:chromosome segregation ATPase
MQYAYENWADASPQTQSELRPPEAVSVLPLSEDLQELEDSLSMNWDDLALSGDTPENRPLRLERDALQMQLEKLWQVADTHYQDNKALAAQIQALLNEREQLRTALHAYELEVSRYRHLMGNLYLKH